MDNYYLRMDYSVGNMLGTDCYNGGIMGKLKQYGELAKCFGYGKHTTMRSTLPFHCTILNHSPVVLADTIVCQMPKHNAEFCRDCQDNQHKDNGEIVKITQTTTTIILYRR
jgi:hypothetical protein